MDNSAKQASAPGTAARRSALDIEDDYSKYEVRSRSELLSILRGMLTQGSPITFYFNQGYDFLLTSLLEIASDGRTLLFDCGSNVDMNRKVLQADLIKCVSTKERVRIEFTLRGVDPASRSERDAFASDLPESLIRLQRREFYRLSTPQSEPIMANIPVPQKEGPVKILRSVVADISCGGVGINVAPDQVSVSEDAQFSAVTISLPYAGVVSADLRVRSRYELTLANGRVQQRAGCQFIRLPGAMSNLIQRYIIQVERERKASGV